MQGFSPVYRYAMKKYLKMPSTWVITVFASAVIGFVLGGVLPFVFININGAEGTRDYVRAVTAAVAAVTTFMSTFVAVYSGFLSARLYRDEVENGTFLSIVAKPLSRSVIVFARWVALLTMLLIYCFISVLFYGIGVSIFDIGSQMPTLAALGVLPISDSLPLVCTFVFIIVFVCSLIFSSIGIMLSVKLSVAATITILISLGIVVPLSSLLSTLLRKEPVRSFTNTNFAVTLGQYPRLVDSYRNQFISNAASLTGSLATDVYRDVNFQSELAKRFYPEIDKQVADYQNFVLESGVANIGVPLSQDETYASVYWADLNLHFTTLAQFAYEKSFPVDLRSQVVGANVSSFLSNYKVEIDHYLTPSDVTKLYNEFFETYDPIASAAWQFYALQFINSTNLSVPGTIGPNGFEEAKFRFPAALARDLLDFFEASTAKIRAGMPQTMINLERELATIDLSSLSFNNYVIRVSRTFMTDFLLFMSGLPTFEEIGSGLARAAFMHSVDPCIVDYSFLAKMTDFSLLKTTGYNNTPSEDEDPFNVLRWEISKYSTPYVVMLRSLWEYNAPIMEEYGIQQTITPAAAKSLISNFQAVIDPLYWQLYYFDRLESAMQFTLLQDTDIKFFSFEKNNAVLIRLVQLAKNNQLAVYKIGEYIDRNNLLIGYVLVALVIVPLAYPIIRRQDFR